MDNSYFPFECWHFDFQKKQQYLLINGRKELIKPNDRRYRRWPETSEYVAPVREETKVKNFLKSNWFFTGTWGKKTVSVRLDGPVT